MIKNICGIYKYENKINHKIYIGQSIRIQARLKQHLQSAYNKNSKDHKLPIHQAILKYGIENFNISILEECSQEKLNEREVYWIKYYNSYKNGYNATEGGNESHIHLGKPIELYDFQGNYITEYSNITEAAKALKVSRNTIYSILHGNRLSTKGFQFKLKEDTNKVIKPYTNKQGGKLPIYQYEKYTTNIIQEWESAAQAARELSLDASTITKCLKGRLKSHGGFSWGYKRVIE